MTPVDQFMRSVRESFASNRAIDWTLMGPLVVLGIGLSIALSVWVGRFRARRQVASRVDAVSTSAGLSPADRTYLTSMAATAQLSVIAIMTDVTRFERATAEVLATVVPTLRPAEGSAFERVRRLRKALGFSPLPAHHWLISTRELTAGDSVALGSVRTQVAEVNEATFAIDLPATAVPGQGALSSLTIDRADDARYLARVRLLGVELLPVSAGQASGGVPVRRAFFGHDEQPERQQHREHVRVRVQTAVKVRIIDPAKRAAAADTAVAAGVGPRNAEPESHAATTPEITSAMAFPAESMIAGTMVDISAGGLSADLPVSPDGPIRKGAQVRCWFALDENEEFEALAAVVGAASIGPGPRAGVQHLRFSFVSLKEAERDRLASAVARRQRAQSLDSDKS